MSIKDMLRARIIEIENSPLYQLSELEARELDDKAYGKRELLYFEIRDLNLELDEIERNEAI